MKLFGLGDDFYRTTKLLWDLRLGETAVFVLRRRTFAATCSLKAGADFSGGRTIGLGGLRRTYRELILRPRA